MTTTYMTEVQKYFAIVKALEDKRDFYKPLWQAIAEVFSPRRNLFSDTKPDKFTEMYRNIIDTTPLLAGKVLAFGLMGDSIPPNSQWVVFESFQKELMERDDIKKYYQDMTDITHDILHASNFYADTGSVYKEYINFGNGCVFGGKHPETLVHFHVLNIGTYAVGVDVFGNVNQLVYRKYLTAENMEKAYGKDKLSDAIKRCIESGNGHEEFEIIHLIIPNEKRDSSKIDSQNKKFLSVHLLADGAESNNEKTILKKSGFDFFPAAFAAWETIGSSVWGLGIAAELLALASILYSEADALQIAIQYMTNPPLSGPRLQDDINLTPAAYNVLPKDVRAVESLWNVNTDINGVVGEKQDIRGQIDLSFYNDLYTMPDFGRNVTATEIAERAARKARLQGPQTLRTETNLLKPLVDIVVNRAFAEGIYPEAPEEIQGSGISYRYNGVFAQAQNAADLNAMVETTQYAMQFLEAGKPEALDKINAISAVEAYGNKKKVPVSFFFTDDEYAQIQEQKAAEQKQLQEQEQINQMAANAETLSKAKTSEPSALTELVDNADQLEGVA